MLLVAGGDCAGIIANVGAFEEKQRDVAAKAAQGCRGTLCCVKTNFSVLIRLG